MALEIIPVKPDFAEVWSRFLPDIRHYLQWCLHDHNDVEEVLQEVSHRCCRGYRTFEGRCPVLNWMLTVAKNTALRYRKKKNVERQKLQPLDHDPEAKPDDCGASESPIRSWIDQAVADHFLDKQHAEILKVRLNHPDDTWPEIASLVALSAENCAQRHLRGIIDFRVYLFLQHPSLLGNREDIIAAFERACCRPIAPLTGSEAEIFRRAVLDRTLSPLKRGVIGPMRVACQKTAQELKQL